MPGLFSCLRKCAGIKCAPAKRENVSPALPEKTERLPGCGADQTDTGPFDNGVTFLFGVDFATDR